jgi:hypothetical protein
MVVTFHTLHHDKWTALICAAVQDGADVRMAQGSQDLPLGAKSLKQRGRLHGLAHRLYGYKLKIMVIRSDGQVDDSHSAAI